MAFNDSRWTRQTLAFNSGRVVTDAGNENGPALFTYASSTDAIATVIAANYFADVVFDLAVDDIIIIEASDADGMYIVSAIDRDAGTISVTGFAPTNSVDTANIVDGAVTAAKLASDAVTTAKILNANVTTAKLADDAVTSAKIDPTVLQYVAVPLSAANILAMYANPVVVLAAGGANTAHVVEHAVLMMTYNSTQYAAGGVIGLQYDSTANLGGEAASSTIAAANIQGAASTMDMVEGAISSGAFSAVANKGLYISNLTAAFTTGDSTFVLHLWYRTVPTV